MPDYRREHDLKTLDCIARQIDGAQDNLHNASQSETPVHYIIDAVKQLAGAVADLTEFVRKQQ